jgi:hypothetical protein
MRSRPQLGDRLVELVAGVELTIAVAVVGLVYWLLPPRETRP